MWILSLSIAYVWATCAVATTTTPAATTASDAHTPVTSVPLDIPVSDISVLAVTPVTRSSVNSTIPQDVTSAAPLSSLSQSPESCPAECSCTSDLQQEYWCLGGALEAVAAPGEFLQVKCWSLFALPALLPALTPHSAPSVSLAGCPAPAAGRGGWAGVLVALGARDVTALRLSGRVPGAPPLSREQFASLPRLSSLTLERTLGANESLPQGLLESLPALTRLRVRGPLAPLQEDAFGAAPRLEALEVAMTSLGEVPAGAFRSLGSLRRLGLWAAGLGALRAGALRGLAELQVLELRGNSLTELPRSLLEDTPRLQNLSLAGNALLEPPAALLAAATLHSLDLSMNRITTLRRQDFASLSSLRSLNLDNNLLEELPQKVFTHLSSIEELSVCRNKLRYIALDAFSGPGARSLRRLLLSGNQLTLSPSAPAAPAAPGGYWDVQRSPLNALLQLQELDLSRNQLATVPTDLRLTLLALTRLDLSYNRLQRLTDADVNFLSWNVVVDMQHNNISLVELSPPPMELSGTESDAAGATVLLQHNPLLCDCRLLELVRRVQAGAGAGAGAGQARLQAEGAVCAGPGELAGRALSAVPQGSLACSLPAPACPPPCACTLLPGASPAPALLLRCAGVPHGGEGAWPDPASYALHHMELQLETWPAEHHSLDALHLPPRLHSLRLAGLQLTTLSLHAPPPSSLALLDLRDNQLGEVPALLLSDNSSTRLLLAGNPLRCDCDHLDSIRLLQQRSQQVEDWSQVQCWQGKGEGAGNATQPLSVSGVPVTSLCVWRWVGVALLVLGVAAVAAAGGAVVLCRRYELPLRVWCVARGVTCCRRTDERDDHERPYDAFISYSHEDEEWVLGVLVARLEAAEGRRLCVHFRDWVAGEYIPAQIARSVEQSRRTLIVLSPAYLRSSWARLEWRAARGEAGARGEGGDGRVVVVLLGEVERGGMDADLRAYLATNTYVKVGDPWFWDKLLYALPPRPRSRPRPDPAAEERDVARKKGFDDRLPGLPRLEELEGGKGREEGALEVRLTPDGKLVNKNKIDIKF